MKKGRKKESHIISRFRRVANMAAAPTYFPERERKPYLRRLWDNLLWLFVRRDLNTDYTFHGSDLVNAGDQFAYTDWPTVKSQQIISCAGGEEWAYNIVTKDKFIFYKWLKRFGIPTPEVFAVRLAGRLYDCRLEPLEEECLQEQEDYIIKQIDGHASSYVRRIPDYTAYREEKETNRHLDLIFQKRIRQDPRLDVLNPHALNTMRVVTIYNAGNPYVLRNALRVGTPLSGSVDNLSAGGVVVGIRPGGYLKEYGYYLYFVRNGEKIDVHPDTGVRFEGFRIPGYQEALELCCRTHRYFYGMHSIGWDVAFSDKGPLILEGNQTWGTQLVELAGEPLKKSWEATLPQEFL